MDKVLAQLLPIFTKYHLVGIGDFTHGCHELSLFKLQLLKYLVKNTTLPIHFFVEDSKWRCDNIMKHTKLTYSKPTMWDGKYPAGKLALYAGYCGESKELLELIKYIRANRNRITIIGADPDVIDRDEGMAKTILANLLPKGKGINIWFAANAHIDMDKYHLHSQKWVQNPQKNTLLCWISFKEKTWKRIFLYT